jgi:hypothetical protein
MGGVAKAVTKPIESVAKEVGRAVGVGGGGSPAPAAAEASPVVRAAMSAGEDTAAALRRRARRGARALLSEARLNPELGVGNQTLGSGPMA